MADSQLSIAKKGEKYTAAQMIEALTVTKGMVTIAAKRLGCDPATVYRYIRLYPTVAQAQRDQREAVTDMAELSLYKAIQEGEGWAVCFYLKTQGRTRGYIERQEVEHSGKGGGPIPVAFFNYDAAVANLTAGSEGDIATSGDDESVIDGETVG